jgi:hypothetical protein
MIASAISPEIPLLAPDRGRPIPGWLLARLRATLGVDFSGVSIHLGPAANAACTALGAAAFALDERVCFAQGSPDPFSPEGLWLLAHELAHIAQQRLGAKQRGAPALVIHLEAEANAAAAAVLQGSPFRVGLSDARGEPACWNLAGHYFITYLMFLNAKVDPDKAQRIALWCWLPDHVKEFHAETIGWNLWKPNSDWEKARDNLAKYEKGATWLDEKQYVTAIHAGLHSLNGGDGVLEAQKRANDFRDTNLPEIIYRALALHPFGDCYSHRKFRGTFNADPTELWDKTTFRLSIGHGLDGHESDDLWDEGRWAVVCAYIRGLGRLANEYKGCKDPDPEARLNDIVAALSPMLRGAPTVQNPEPQSADEPKTWPHVVPDWRKISEPARKLAKEKVSPDEYSCIRHIRKVAEQLVQVDMGNKFVHSDPIEWSQYCDRYRDSIIADAGTDDFGDVFHQIQLCAAKWSGTVLHSAHRRARRAS